MSIPFDSVPEGLTKQIKRVSAYRKNVAKIQVNTAATASPGDTVEIQLPSKGIIDMASLIFQATVTIATADSVCPEPEEFFRRVTLECDGATIVDIDYYNDIFCMYKNATCSTSHCRQRNCYSNDNFGLKRKLDTATLSDATTGSIALYRAMSEVVVPIDPTIALATTTGYIVREIYDPIAAAGTARMNATCFLGIQDLGFIDTSIFPSLRLKLQLAQNNILGGVAAATGTFSLSSMTLLVPQIILPAYTNNILQLLAPDANGNSETLYYKFRRYLPYIFSSSVANINSLKFSLSSSSLDRVWLTMKKSQFSTQAVQRNGDCINYFKMQCNDSVAANNTIQYITLNVDNEAIDGGVKDDLRYNGYIRNMQELGVLNNTQYDNLIDSNFGDATVDVGTVGTGYSANYQHVFPRAEFKRYKWFWVKSLKYEGDQSAMSGYNCMGSLANIALDIEFLNAPSANCVFYAIAECSALLAVSAGRSISTIL